MSETDLPLSLRERYATCRAEADLLKEQRLLRESKAGFFKTWTLPLVIWLCVVETALFSTYHWVLKPLREINELRAHGRVGK